MINFSSLAKPFERTDNSFRLKETVSTTERLPTPGRSSRLTNKNIFPNSVEVVQPINQNNKKVVSLTTGFSIRRNLNNTNNPYTLTVLTRPFDNFNQSHKTDNRLYNKDKPIKLNSYNVQNNNDAREISIESQEDTIINAEGRSSESSMRRKDTSSEIVSDDDDDLPDFVRPIKTKQTVRPRIKLASVPSTTATTKYYLKTVVKRPAPFSSNNDKSEDSTENVINTEALIDTGLQNVREKGKLNVHENGSIQSESPTWEQYEDSEEIWNKPIVSPYRTLNNLRNSYNRNENSVQDYTTSTTSTTRYTAPSTTQREYVRNNVRKEEISSSKPSYYSYRVEDDDIPDQTTEVFSGTVKNIIKAFFSLGSTPKSQEAMQFTSTTPKLTTYSTTILPEEKVVNIGYQKKPLKYVDEKPYRYNVKRLQIITEPTINRFISPSVETTSYTEREYNTGFSSTTPTTTTLSTMANAPVEFSPPETTPLMQESSTTNDYRNSPVTDLYQSKFNRFITSTPKQATERPYNENSRKFQNIISQEPSSESNDRDKISYNIVDDEVTKLTKTNSEPTKTPTETEWDRPTNKIVSEIATTTSTTKSTTMKIETTSTTKSLSFPTRASRVNPAIKLAATNLGGGRRSYQSSSKCSSDNSLQANPKCNEIKYQRYYTPASS